MNIGDTVLYTELDQTYVATVLEVRELDGHLGKNNEPLLHLGFFINVEKPGADGKPKPVKLVGTHDQYSLAQFRLDVVHQSHEFPEGIGGKKPVYPGGRWVEAKVTAGNDLFLGDSSPEEPVEEPEGSEIPPDSSTSQTIN